MHRYQFHDEIWGGYGVGRDRATADNRPVILFLHGFLGDRTDFDTVIPHLQDTFCCLSLDLPGHGETVVHSATQDSVDTYAMPQIAAAIAQWLTDLNIPQSYLVGYSMGGRLALYLALHYPQIFPKVVIESASPGLMTAMERQQRMVQDALLAEKLQQDFPRFLDDWYALPLWRSLRCHPDFADLRQRRSRHHPARLAQMLQGMGTGQQPSLWEKLPAHRQPLLLVAGAADDKFMAINQRMAALCPMAQCLSVPNAGHNVHWEQPQFFGQALWEFFTPEF